MTFRAEHEFLKHPCVVKLLPQRVSGVADDAAQRLHAEAAAGFRVNDAHVVRVLDCDVYNGLWYFVMEYVDGFDFATLLSAGLTPHWRQTVRIAIDAARGLAAIHAAGLVHRDVKPANLILGKDGKTRVADLGVAGLIETSAVQGTSESFGTLAYAAPEVFIPHDPVDLRADLYSLGAAMFELLTGQPPHAGAGVCQAVLSVSTRRMHWPEDAPQEIPTWVRETVLQLLEQDPDARPSSAAEIIERLERSDGPRQEKPAAEIAVPRPCGLVIPAFANTGDDDSDDWVGIALAEHLSRSVCATGDLFAADREQFESVRQRVRRTADQTDTDALLAAARLLGAAIVIEGEFRKTQDAIEVRVLLHRRQSSEPLALEPLRGTLPEWTDLQARLHAQVTAGLELVPAPAARPGGAAAMSAQKKFFMGKRAFLGGEYEKAARLGREALDIDPEFGEAIGFVGVCCARMGRYTQAEEYHRRQERLARRRGEGRLVVEAQANLGSMYYFQGEYEAAHAALAGAVDSATRLGLEVEAAQISNNLGFVLFQLSRPDEAQTAFRRAIETHKAYDALLLLVGPYNGLGNVLRSQERYDEARNFFGRALALAQESDDAVNVGVAYMNLGHCASLQGRPVDARHELAVALNILERTRFWNGLARVYEYMADLNLRTGNLAEAGRCAAKRISLAQRHANRRVEADAWRQYARAHTSAGREDKARECRDRAEQIDAQRDSRPSSERSDRLPAGSPR